MKQLYTLQTITINVINAKLKHTSALFSVIVLLFCTSAHAQGWTQKTDLTDKRYNPVAFCINNKVYVAGGDNGTVWPTTTRTDLLEYDIATDTWSQKGSLPGTDPGCSNGVGFAINGKGYIGLGFGAGSAKNELWEYDPANDNWNQMASLPTGRYGAASFVVNNKAYIVGGFESGMIATVWEFDPAANTWTSKSGFSGGPDGDLEGFAINDKGYILGGDTPNGVTKNLYQYNPANNQWIFKGSFPGTARQGHMMFVLNNKAYCSGGAGGAFPPPFSPTYNDIFSYDPATNSWTAEGNFPGPARCLGFACSDGAKAYLGAGLDNTLNQGTVYQDFYEFTPPAIATSINSFNNDHNNYVIYPNPSNNNFHLSGIDLTDSPEYQIYTPESKKVQEGIVSDGLLKTDHLSNGMYMLHLNMKGNIIHHILVIEN